MDSIKLPPRTPSQGSSQLTKSPIGYSTHFSASPQTPTPSKRSNVPIDLQIVYQEKDIVRALGRDTNQELIAHNKKLKKNLYQEHQQLVQMYNSLTFRLWTIQMELKRAEIESDKEGLSNDPEYKKHLDSANQKVAGYNEIFQLMKKVFDRWSAVLDEKAKILQQFDDCIGALRNLKLEGLGEFGVSPAPHPEDQSDHTQQSGLECYQFSHT